jgi:hypothetical protein
MELIILFRAVVTPMKSEENGYAIEMKHGREIYNAGGSRFLEKFIIASFFCYVILAFLYNI